MPLLTQLQAVLAAMDCTLKQLAQVKPAFLGLLLVRYLITAVRKVVNVHSLLFPRPLGKHLFGFVSMVFNISRMPRDY